MSFPTYAGMKDVKLARLGTEEFCFILNSKYQ